MGFNKEKAERVGEKIDDRIAHRKRRKIES